MDLEVALSALRDDDPTAPGIVVMATDARDGAVAAAGLAVVEHSLPLAIESRVYAASLTKLVTALCVHRLSADGRLSLDQPVAEWFPALADGRRITVRQLLLHRSGLPEYHALRLVAGHSVDDRLEHADIRRLVDGMTVWFEPGSRVSYNNTNFAMLAMIVADVTGGSFAAAAHELVLGPAGMVSAVVKEHADDILERAAAGYVRHGQGYRRAVMGLASTGDGGLWWTGTDMAAFGRWLLGDHPEVAAMRKRVPLPDGSLPTLASGCTVAADGSWFGGIAEFTGFAAELRVYPDHGIAVGAMTNRQDGRPGRRLDDVVRTLGLPEPVVAAPPQRRAAPAPTGTLVGAGGAPWHFRPDDPAQPDDQVVAVNVDSLSFRMVPIGDGWQVDGMPTHTAGWEGDEFVVRDRSTEVARLTAVDGDPPSDTLTPALAGWWWCAAAHTALEVTAADDEWWLRRGQGAREPLRPVGERNGRWVLAAPWGLVELDHDGRRGRVVVHRAEGLELVRLVAHSPV